MLLANYSQTNRNTTGGYSQAFTNPFNNLRAVNFNNFYCGNAVVTGETDKSAFNNGYNTEFAWWLSPKSGGLGSVNQINGTGSFAGNGALGKNAEADLSGGGDLTATAQLIISMIAALTGSGSLTAAAEAFLQLAANLVGSGDFEGALVALGNAASSLAGSGTLAATSNALGALDADVVVTGSGLTTSNVGAAVWDAVASLNNTAGTMGNKLNSAASGGVDYDALANAVWAALKSANNDPGSMGEAMNDMLDSSVVDAIKDALMAELESTTIPVDVQKMNGADVLGDGTAGNLWRGGA